MKKPKKKDLERALFRIANMKQCAALEIWQRDIYITIDPSMVAAHALNGKDYRPNPWWWEER